MNNLKHVWSMICATSTVDSVTNNVSLINILEDLQLTVDKSQYNPDLKMVVPFQFQLVTLLSKTKESQGKQIFYEEKIDLIDPKGDCLDTKISPEVEIKDSQARHRFSVNILGLPITVKGEYCFKISIKERGQDSFLPISEVSIHIDVIQQ